ncbi:pyridoxal phosphate-dependent aminotransferase [Henriciella aquimarina]|uniref:pyridoxal phosphate-dependent aminotransferase n=1 Tax=Henriciella aquimarina TaxID=545261 RepID=UPI000A045A45|nr:histidinol-phosphate transaminase [Henriciella aquimarina]
MAYDLSRRAFFGAGMAGLAGCASAGMTSLTAEAQGAFPPSPSTSGMFGPEEGLAQLSRNENPYGPAPSALKGISKAAEAGAYYTSMRSTAALQKLIAERHGLDPAQIVITTGSGEALSALALMNGPKGPILAPRLFWDTTALYAANLGLAEIQRVPLTSDMEIDLPTMEAKATSDIGMVQLCNPNNPTGLVLPGSVIRPAVERMAAKTTVVVDEAYIELADDPDATTCIPLVKAGHDVVVTRTFSKIYGMAGIRVGYTISSEETAEKIRATAMSWTPCTSFGGAIGCYNDEGFLKMSRGKIVEAREMVTSTLDTLGMEYLPSQTNFVYFKSGLPAEDLRARLAEKKIAIRGQYMDYTDLSRVSMGRIEDVERFCRALPEVVGA